MIGYSKNIQAYKNAFASVDKINQVIMLYDTAIASMQQARQHITEKNIQERFNKISKTFQILTGLKDALDHEKGGDIVGVLSDWYSGTALRVLSVNRTEDLDMCDLCIAHIKQMRDAWVEIEKQIKSGADEKPAETSTATTGSGNPTGSIQASASNSNDDFFETIAKGAYGSGNSGGMIINV